MLDLSPREEERAEVGEACSVEKKHRICHDEKGSAWAGLSGFERIATRRTLGTASLSSSKLLPKVPMPTPREALDEAELDGIIDNREPDPTRRHLGRDGRGESSGRG